MPFGQGGSAQASLFTIGQTPIAISTRAPAGGQILIANVGGLDAKLLTSGPDDAMILFGGYVPGMANLDQPDAFLLLSGAYITLPADVTPLSAVAVNTVTTLSIAVASVDD